MSKRVLLSLELLVLCGPAAYLLFIGLLYLPAFLLLATSGHGDWHIRALMIFFGLWGFISLGNLTMHIMSKEQNWPGRPFQWAGIAMGVISCLIGLSIMGNGIIMHLIFSGPIAAAIHLLYLSRTRGLAS